MEDKTSYEEIIYSGILSPWLDFFLHVLGGKQTQQRRSRYTNGKQSSHNTQDTINVQAQ